MVAAGFPSAASHWATTTDFEPAWTVTTLAEFLVLAGGGEMKKEKKKKRQVTHKLGSQRRGGMGFKECGEMTGTVMDRCSEQRHIQWKVKDTKKE